MALLHPGPSVLVTLLFVASAGAAQHRLPDPLTILRLSAIMLPTQFAIGALNDLCDLDLDRLTKPQKPLVAGIVRPWLAGAVALAGFGIGQGVAATFPLPTLPLAAGCAAAGISYDLGLKRGPLSWLPWWVGFSCLPLCAWAAEQHLATRAAIAVGPLALFLALSLHLANAAPDAAADRQAGSTGLAVRLGADRSRRLSLGLAALAALAAPLAAPLLGQPLPIVALGALPLLATAALLALRPRLRPFPILAPAMAVLSALWVLSLP